MKSFDNKIAVVTGGGNGMGRTLVQQLTAAGCHVAFCDISSEDMAGTIEACREQMPQGTRLTAHSCDVSNEAAMQAFADEVAAQHDTDHINLLFNNAGITGGQSFVKDDQAQWDKTFAICWGGVYNGCRVFMPMLLAAEEGHIVNTASVNSFWACMGPQVEHSAYSTAKFAVRGFTESLVVDLRVNAPHIKVSVVLPGHIGTSIILNTQKMWSGGAATMDEESIATARERWSRNDPDAAQLNDDQVRELAQAGAEQFRDAAPTTAWDASTAILDGVKAQQWRILVGDDAFALDAVVRADPENTYNLVFDDVTGNSIP